MGDCEEDLVSKPQEELGLAFHASSTTDPAHTLETFCGEFQNLRKDQRVFEYMNIEVDKFCSIGNVRVILTFCILVFSILKVVNEKEKEREEFPGWLGQIECKYYLGIGGCKFGKACRYNHPREKTVVGPPLELNFLGLPIRLGETECPFYMRTGSCKYGADCRFHHPDPTAVGGCDPPSGYLNGGSVPLCSSASQSAVTSWSSLRISNETGPYMDTSTSYVPVMLSPRQGVHPNPEWNGYQALVYPPERSIHPPSALVVNNLTKQADASRHHQQQMLVEEFPERPGQPDCSYFVKTGDCKYRYGCKFNHPKNRAPKSPVCVLNDKGLPLRPDQDICMHYSRYGICKFGPACRFDHQ
ncbi:hypothetical protein HHK36_007510 [Tetracentron sinense]|uniref:C3H1-type domain-containing protein n=1 Tax=Tetracentron sinense TaxID=13715 RepID=A0A835DLU9_TETSI|nr:hypothetical protein HHK36_007510 [Tetracentron sinense]